MDVKAEHFFEVSWEVCNKVGGIYTVVTSKIIPMLHSYKDRYYAVGPFFPGVTKQDEFKEAEPPEVFKKVFGKLKEKGIICHFGNWLIEGEPNTILVDYSGFTYAVDDMKKENWERFRIDSLNSAYHDYDEPMLWSRAVGMLIEEFKLASGSDKIAAQFHEWMAGGGLLYLKERDVKAGTIFTTHATMLGRTLAANNEDLYGIMDKIDPEERAYKYNIQAKFHTERACAQESDAFTTVSEITGIEATYFLGKKPDVLLPNGLDMERFPTFDDASIKHKLFKAKIKRFLTFYFFPYYQFDMDDTLIYFLAGRYEFQNKGIDVYIDALAKLNEEMKAKGSEKTIIAFIWVPGAIKEIRYEILENKSYYDDVHDSIQDSYDEIKERLIYGIVGRKDIDEEFLLGSPLMKQTHKRLARLSRQGLPPLCTHHLYDEDNNLILEALKKKNLLNRPEDKVKVIFYPIYLTGADQLTDLNYYEAIMACHLGVFPSYYEPWGYTPLETGALGIASVTTDLAGFGRYIQKTRPEKKNPGIYVLERENKSYGEIVDSLAKIFSDFASCSKQDRIENKLKAKRIANLADWNILADNYIKAHNLAIEKVTNSLSQK